MILKGGGTNTGVRKEAVQMNEKGLFHAGYGPPLDLPNTGSMSLQFGEPISLGEFARQHQRGGSGGSDGGGSDGEEEWKTQSSSTDNTERREMVRDLAYHIMDRLHATSICHGTHLVAATLLMYRSAGSITFKDLEHHVRWLSSEVQARGMGVDMAPRHPTQWPTAIRRALGLLKECVREVRPGVFACNDYADVGAGTEDPRIHFIELSILRNKTQS